MASFRAKRLNQFTGALGQKPEGQLQKEHKLKKGSVQVRDLVKRFVILSSFNVEELFSASTNSQAGESPLVDCPRPRIQYIRGHPPYLEAVPPSATSGRVMLRYTNYVQFT